MNICLMGFMGCGKSTVGTAVADKLGWKYIDTDTLIEDKFQMDIPSIFRDYGEAKFREAELKVLEAVMLSEDAVISTGGGLPCNDKAINMINNNCSSYYLYMSIEQLTLRLWNQELLSARPLLESINSQDDLSEFVKVKLIDRERYYYDSHGIIDANQELDIIVDDITQLVQPAS